MRRKIRKQKLKKKVLKVTARMMERSERAKTRAQSYDLLGAPWTTMTTVKTICVSRLQTRKKSDLYSDCVGVTRKVSVFDFVLI